MFGVRVWLAFVAGCGRVSFDASDPPDAAQPTELRIGDRDDADVRTGIADTFLDEGTPTNNYGTHRDLHVGNTGAMTGLVKFVIADVTALQVASAELHLWVLGGDIPAMTELEVTRVLEPWTEGTEDFNAGVANHVERIAGTPWSEPGAGAPSSRDGAVLARAVGPVAIGERVVLDLPPALVAGWIAGNANNHGIALRLAGAPGYVELTATNYVDQSQRPLLVLRLVP